MQKRKVDAKKFRGAKILFNSGATIMEVAEYFDISTTTAQRIKTATDFEDYTHAVQMAALYAKKNDGQGKEKKEEPPKPAIATPVQGSYQMNRLIEIIKEQNEILKIMSNKIAFIVDELTK